MENGCVVGIAATASTISTSEMGLLVAAFTLLFLTPLMARVLLPRAKRFASQLQERGRFRLAPS